LNQFEAEFDSSTFLQSQGDGANGVGVKRTRRLLRRVNVDTHGSANPRSRASSKAPSGLTETAGIHLRVAP
jgi:hypothetical protein